MHPGEPDISAPLVRRLLRGQFPRWADLSLVRVPSSGTDHALFRLGDDLVVRLPRVDRAVSQARQEAAWLPGFRTALPLQVPDLVVLGSPGAGYPWPWAVYRWIPGADGAAAEIADPVRDAEVLAAFLHALRRIDASGAPLAGARNGWRGAGLEKRDSEVRAAIDALGGDFPQDLLAQAWEASLHAAAWSGPPVWLHGDLLPGNLIYRDGELAALIDFGCFGVGDPACDLMAGWTIFSGRSRGRFREAMACGEADWLRGRGWALSFGLIAFPYYRRSNPGLAAVARRAIEQVLEDFVGRR